MQNYTNGDNVEIVDGKLVITAKLVDDNYQPGSYTSARLTTQGKVEYRYGRMVARLRLPAGTGVWPAFWMLGSNFSSVGWPMCGEMDIMEYVGFQPNTTHAYVHMQDGFAGGGIGNSIIVETCEEAFHIYGLDWTEDALVFWVDEPENVVHTYAPEVKTNENWPFSQPAFFILNLAVGGSWGGQQGIDNSIFPQTLEVDYVKVYQKIE